MEADNFIVKCSKCKRKMLVTQVLFGVNHTAGIAVTCPDCTAKFDWDNDEWVKENPEEAKELKAESKSELMDEEQFIKEWNQIPDRKKVVYVTEKGGIYATCYSVDVFGKVTLWRGDNIVASNIAFDKIKWIG